MNSHNKEAISCTISYTFGTKLGYKTSYRATGHRDLVPEGFHFRSHGLGDSAATGHPPGSKGIFTWNLHLTAGIRSLGWIKPALNAIYATDQKTQYIISGITTWVICQIR